MFSKRQLHYYDRVEQGGSFNERKKGKKRKRNTKRGKEKKIMKQKVKDKEREKY